MMLVVFCWWNSANLILWVNYCWWNAVDIMLFVDCSWWCAVVRMRMFLLHSIDAIQATALTKQHCISTHFLFLVIFWKILRTNIFQNSFGGHQTCLRSQRNLRSRRSRRYLRSHLYKISLRSL